MCQSGWVAIIKVNGICLGGQLGSGGVEFVVQLLFELQLEGGVGQLGVADAEAVFDAFV